MSSPPSQRSRERRDRRFRSRSRDRDRRRRHSRSRSRSRSPPRHRHRSSTPVWQYQQQWRRDSPSPAPSSFSVSASASATSSLSRRVHRLPLETFEFVSGLLVISNVSHNPTPEQMQRFEWNEYHDVRTRDWETIQQRLIFTYPAPNASATITDEEDIRSVASILFGPVRLFPNRVQWIARVRTHVGIRSDLIFIQLAPLAAIPPVMATFAQSKYSPSSGIPTYIEWLVRQTQQRHPDLPQVCTAMYQRADRTGASIQCHQACRRSHHVKDMEMILQVAREDAAQSLKVVATASSLTPPSTAAPSSSASSRPAVAASAPTSTSSSSPYPSASMLSPSKISSTSPQLESSHRSLGLLFVPSDTPDLDLTIYRDPPPSYADLDSLIANRDADVISRRVVWFDSIGAPDTSELKTEEDRRVDLEQALVQVTSPNKLLFSEIEWIARLKTEDGRPSDRLLIQLNPGVSISSALERFPPSNKGLANRLLTFLESENLYRPSSPHRPVSSVFQTPQRLLPPPSFASSKSTPQSDTSFVTNSTPPSRQGLNNSFNSPSSATRLQPQHSSVKHPPPSRELEEEFLRATAFNPEYPLPAATTAAASGASSSQWSESTSNPQIKSESLAYAPSHSSVMRAQSTAAAAAASTFFSSSSTSSSSPAAAASTASSSSTHTLQHTYRTCYEIGSVLFTPGLQLQSIIDTEPEHYFSDQTQLEHQIAIPTGKLFLQQYRTEFEITGELGLRSRMADVKYCIDKFRRQGFLTSDDSLQMAYRRGKEEGYSLLLHFFYPDHRQRVLARFERAAEERRREEAAQKSSSVSEQVDPHKQ